MPNIVATHSCRLSGMDSSGVEPAEIRTNCVEPYDGSEPSEINYVIPVAERDGYQSASVNDWQPPRPPEQPGTEAPPPPPGGVAGYWIVDRRTGLHAYMTPDGRSEWVPANNVAEPKE